MTNQLVGRVQQGLLAAHRRLLREGEVATAAVGGGKLQLLIFNDILVPFPKSKLSKLGASKKAIADSKEFQWPLELVWLKDDPSLGTIHVLPTAIQIATKLTHTHMTITDKKNQYFFDIMGPSKVYNIKVNTAEEKAQWLRELRNAMEGAKNIQQHPINKVRTLPVSSLIIIIIITGIIVIDSRCSVECRNWATVVGASSNSVTRCTMRATGEAAWYA